jgi:hypothetical protein
VKQNRNKQKFCLVSADQCQSCFISVLFQRVAHAKQNAEKASQLVGPAAVCRQITCQSKVAIDMDDEISVDGEMLCELVLAATVVSVVASKRVAV